MLRKHKLSEKDRNGQELILQRLQEELKEPLKGKEVNNFPARWLPASFALLPEGFTEQNQQLNSTLKIVRSKIIETYKSEIEFLYTPEGKQVNNEYNHDVINRIFQPPQHRPARSFPFGCFFG